MTRLALIASMFVAACGVTPQADEPASAFTNGKADGSTWCHANFDSTGGTQMVFDYQVQSPGELHDGFTTTASPVWLNVTNDAFGATDQASAVIVTYSYIDQCGPSCSQGEFSTSFDVALAYQEGRFTALAPDLPLKYAASGDDVSTLYYWELAVVIDGQWYKDPTSSNNLRTYPGDSPGNCEPGYPL